ncbi:kelch-like ECH-associated protein 1 [Pollicipes pollicipes]|uniref:kelch-like ECH-associated protein 1 n=1 Tax=Pollicipes pollicipes TaxID=41117 RepID=UPI0018851DCE|nr:kelch-like ECH-associated protein 1 [Pollicipes pollicipes]
MFTSGLRESSMSSIKLQGVCTYTFSRLLLFAYTGEITVNEQTVCALLPAATMFQMQHVVEVCCNFLRNQLEPSNAIGIATFAEQHGCMELLHTATQFIEQHFTQIVQEEEFLMLNPTQLIKLIHRDELNVFDERDVYAAVVKWVKYDEKTRQPKMECIMRSVRCELLPPRYLKDQLENQPLLQGSENCREYLANIFRGGYGCRRRHAPLWSQNAPFGRWNAPLVPRNAPLGRQNAPFGRSNDPLRRRNAPAQLVGVS